MTARFMLVALVTAALPALAAAEPASTAAQVPGPPPQALMQETAQRMLDALEAGREEYRSDPRKVDELVDRVLLPHFDTDYAARLVLGKHWRSATPTQRERFVNAFYHSMLNRYGAALAEFTADRMVILPFRGNLADGRAIVRTEVRTDDGTRVPVHYSMRATPQGWKAWDVTIEGVSYVKNFREDFNTEIAQRGLESVIGRLEAAATAAAGGNAH